MLIRNEDEKLTNGYLALIERPGKNRFQAEGYCAVMLLSVCRKILPKIILQRIRPVLDKEISLSQYAYMTGKSTGDVVLTPKYSISGAEMKGMVKSCVGIDLSKAFDIVDRYKVLKILKKEELGMKTSVSLNAS